MELRPYFWPALLLKLGAGILLGLIYKYYYSIGDTFGFFDDACKLSALFWSEPGAYFTFLVTGDESDLVSLLLINTQSRSLFFVKIVSMVGIIAGDNYWVASLYFSLISFLAAFLLFQKVSFMFPGSRLAASIGFLFFPSVVFWSSGIIKESLALAGLLILAHVYVTLITNSKPFWWEWMLAFISVFIVWNLKYYWAAVFIPVACTTLLVHVITQRTKLKWSNKILIWIASFLVFCFGVTLVHPNFYLENFLQVLVDNYNEFIRISPQGIVVHYQLEPSWWSVILNSPFALLTGIFRPFVWEASTFLQLAVAIENLIILILFISTFIRLFSQAKSQHRLLIFSVAAYVVILCLFLSLSTPNLGTLARYKVGFQPFLIFIVFADNFIVDWLKVKLNFKGKL
ncbi:MAG: hypothetical protein JJE09_11435 [Bacteroidia bacterium]|nr:hypothetical protein [Bacteroidia bacterium]